MQAYLTNNIHRFIDRRIRITVGNVVLLWRLPCSGMPQNIFFVSFALLMLINKPSANMPLIKFVYDVTTVELINDLGSQMKTVIGQIADWSHMNFMLINPIEKSKEMIFGSAKYKKVNWHHWSCLLVTV